MSDIIQFLTYLVTNHGYGAAVLFVILGIIPMLLGTIIVVLKSSIGKIIDKRIAASAEKDKEIHKEGNRIRKQFNKNTLEILQELAEETNVDRALIFEYSNGTSNLVGMPFLYMSVTAEVVTPNTSPVGHLYQKMNLSVASDFLAKLETTGYIYIENLESQQNEYPVLAHFMLPNNVKSALFYSITGIDETIGFIVITTVTNCKEVLDKTHAIPTIAKAAQKISALLNFSDLSNNLDKNKRKWWRL